MRRNAPLVTRYVLQRDRTVLCGYRVDIECWLCRRTKQWDGSRWHYCVSCSAHTPSLVRWSRVSRMLSGSFVLVRRTHLRRDNA